MSQTIFDFHIHLGMDIYGDFNKYNEQLDEIKKLKNLKGGVLITPTYICGKDSTVTLNHIKTTNTYIANLICNTDGKFWGFCGVPIHNDYAIDVAEHAFKLKGIIGIKLRNFTLDPLINGNFFGHPDTISNRFEKLIELANNNHSMVLAHFSGETEIRQNGIPTITHKLLNIMNKYPNAKLIIAHSGIYSFIGLDGLSYIGEQYLKNPHMPKNIYIDVAKCFGMGGVGIVWNPTTKKYVHKATWADAEEYIKAWKKFGINRVLYGSDLGCANDHKCQTHVDELDISDCPYLTDKEKLDIYQLNGEKLIQ